jgi:S1 RNA binding domain protein
MSIEVGSVVEGKVTGITNFGAFIELSGGETGLVHISEIADTYVKNVEDYLKMYEQIKVKVISIDDDGKIGLSIKQLDDKNKKAPKVPFEEQMKDFIKESDERQQDLKKSIESKRGGSCY